MIFWNVRRWNEVEDYIAHLVFRKTFRQAICRNRAILSIAMLLEVTLVRIHDQRPVARSPRR